MKLGCNRQPLSKGHLNRCSTTGLAMLNYLLGFTDVAVGYVPDQHGQSLGVRRPIVLVNRQFRHRSRSCGRCNRRPLTPIRRRRQ